MALGYRCTLMRAVALMVPTRCQCWPPKKSHSADNVHHSIFRDFQPASLDGHPVSVAPSASSARYTARGCKEDSSCLDTPEAVHAFERQFRAHLDLQPLPLFVRPSPRLAYPEGLCGIGGVRALARRASDRGTRTVAQRDRGFAYFGTPLPSGCGSKHRTCQVGRIPTLHFGRNTAWPRTRSAHAAHVFPLWGGGETRGDVPAPSPALQKCAEHGHHGD